MNRMMKMTEDRDRNNEGQARGSPLFTLIFTRPAQCIAARQLHLVVDLFDCILDRGPQVPVSHIEGHCDISAVAFTVDVVSPILDLNLAELRQRDTLSGRREQANVTDSLLRVAVLSLVAHHYVVPLLVDQHLAYRVAAHCRLHGILDVRHVDSKTGRHLAVDRQIKVWLAKVAQQFDVVHAWNGGHHGSDLVALLLQNGKIIAKDLKRQRSLGTGHRLSDVVLNRLGEVPDSSRILLHCQVHGGDQFLFVLVKYWPPLVMRLQIDKILGVPETAGVGSVIGPSRLRHNGLHLGKRCKDQALLLSEFFAFRETGAVGQRSARPDGAFVEVRQELRPDGPAESQIDRSSHSNHAHPCNDPAMCDRPAQLLPIPGRDNFHDTVSSFLESPLKEDACQYRHDEDGERHGAQQSEGNRPCHGPEEPSFDALQREDRHISGDDDCDGVEDWPLHLVAGLADDLGCRLSRLSWAYVHGYGPDGE